jgi:cellulose synthase/poly-beta-1,6-N-acetylglucosamine synthase-like glycosyltransferase/peptidoglycan/xylan/chitin deacetylase (PgdA/CDA1 family)/spore germination protein YaaH
MTTPKDRHTSFVFQDHTGRRARIVRQLGWIAAIVSTIGAAVLVAGLVIPPLLPRVTIADKSAGTPRFAGSRATRERIAAKRQLFAALASRPRVPAMRRSILPVRPTKQPHAVTPGRPLSAGFYVNWDDNSFVSLKAHASQLDWVICEWGFLARNANALDLRIDRRVLFLVQHLPAAERPAVHLMLTNYDSARADFDPAQLRVLVATPASRAVIIGQLVSAVRQYGLGGVTVDLEQIPDALQPGVAAFVKELGRQLHSAGAVISQALPADTPLPLLRRYAALNDRIILMLYDEHSEPHSTGPVASQAWYEAQARRAAAVVPADKLVLAVGAYAYDWNDAEPNAVPDEQTFQDVMRLAREHGAEVHFDSRSLNPYMSWTASDSTDHAFWFLDGVTAFNELRVARTLGAGGSALWRLGSEDPTVWSVLGRGSAAPSADALRTLTAGYDVEFRGTGEVLRIDQQPTNGRRDIRVDVRSGFVMDERITGYPSPYVVARTGNVPRRVALTLDDGPDAKWTGMILDTLRSRHAPATFFVIGSNVEMNIGLTRRIAREGHEVGNHTFTHPNLAMTSPLVTRLELDATERIIEAVLDRRSAFFRPPYFGDAEPTTADELVPVSLATSLGYVTAGLHVDSEDWTQPSPETIVQNVLEGRRRAITCSDSLHDSRGTDTPLEHGCSGSVVLLHDGGGDRRNTVAALGTLIDSLRAQGDSLVLLSSLAGITHEEAMPPLPASSSVIRLSELVAFGALGSAEWIFYWIFLSAVVLGMIRLLLILVLATIQRTRSHRAARTPAAQHFAPSVSVIVPAFREERVIAKTIESLLSQEYAGDLEVIVVDDGSPDATYDRAVEAFGNDPRVSVFRKSNGGKASALNYGLARARGEIVVGLDADTVFLRDSIRRLVRPLADAHVGAVAGNAKVGNRLNIVTRWQALEYVTSQNLDRRAFALLDCVTVVPGAIGAWRTESVRKIGGFSDDTLAEDQDLTLSLLRAGYTVAYADDAIAYTEAPDTLRGLANQRFRWSFGTLQCIWKHRAAFMRRGTGTLGWIAMPNVWLFQLIFPALSPLADVMFLWSLFSVWLVAQQHGSTYALVNLRQVLMFYGVFLLVDWIAAVVGFIMEPGEDKRLTWLVFLQRFVYRQVMYLVVVRSFRAAIRGRIVGWGTLERKATVVAP